LNVWKHAHADHDTYAIFWRDWLAKLEVIFIVRTSSGVAACYGILAVLNLDLGL
jgi:hypothetical protein